MDLLDKLLPGDAKPPAPTPFGRIPKRGSTSRPEEAEPSSKRNTSSSSSSRPMFSTASSATPDGRDTFTTANKVDIQMNSFKLSISRMPERIERIHIDVILQQSNGKEFNLSDGLASVSGDVNSHNSRLARSIIMSVVLKQRKDLFGGDASNVAYDCASTIYCPAGIYSGNEEEKFVFTKADFSTDQWNLVSIISRRKNDTYVLSLKRAEGFSTREMNEESNRAELTRLVEILTSQNLNQANFHQFGNATFPMEERPISEPDGITEIRPGFAKTARVAENGEMLMTIDTKQAPFFKESSVIKFIISKTNEAQNRGRGGGGGGHGGYRGGGRGGRDHSRYDRRDGYREESRDPRDHGRRDSYDSRRDYSRGRGDSARESTSNVDFDSHDVRDLQRAFEEGRGGRGSRSFLDNVEQMLKGLFVKATHLEGGNSIIMVSGIYQGTAADTQFEMKGSTDKITVEKYFYDHHGIKLTYPHLPLIFSKRTKQLSFYPMELMKILAGQRIKLSKMSATVQSAMTGRNAAMPLQHTRLVQDILKNSLRLRDNQHMKAFGVELTSTDPIRLKADLLEAPMIKFKNGSLNPQRNCPFKGRNVFVDPAKIECVALIVFDRCMEMRMAEDFCDRLGDICRECNITVKEKSSRWPIKELSSSDLTEIKSQMSKFLKDGVSIVVGIAAEKKPDVHDVLKYYEESLGMQTLQLCRQTVDQMLKSNGGAQTTDNVMRKFNLKCGGTNFYVEIPSKICPNTDHVTKKLLTGTLFIGFEISHGSAKTLYDRQVGGLTGDPSFVGVSYSMSHSTSLGGFTYIQTCREYKLQHLDTKFPECVKAYTEEAKQLPSRIVIYRVGAGEGDYRRVKEEVEEIRNTFDSIQKGWKPPIVMLIAQRASHSRVFPAEIRGNRPQEQNVMSGTCVSQGVTSYGHDEFILSSQSPLIGTVRPCKYTILVNDPKWSKNELMHLTYFRAFGHQVSYQPPAVPDVLYAAENLAKRGRNNWKIHRRFLNLQKLEHEIIEKHSELNTEQMKEELSSAIIDELSHEMNQMTIRKRNFWA